jgi:hypothetical protein
LKLNQFSNIGCLLSFSNGFVEIEISTLTPRDKTHVILQ